jgi:hypothetical protein
VRQIARRAREHVGARRPRERVNRAEQQAVVERFLLARRSGQLQALLEALAPNVVLIADGGGLMAAAPAPVYGAGLVATLLARSNRAAMEASLVWLNGWPAARLDTAGQLAAVSLGGGKRSLHPYLRDG